MTQLDQEMHATYVRASELPRRRAQVGEWFRRLLRMERRRYLMCDLNDGARRAIGTFSSEADYQMFLTWLAHSNKRTFDYAFALGKEHRVAQYLADEADAGHAGTP